MYKYSKCVRQNYGQACLSISLLYIQVRKNTSWVLGADMVFPFAFSNNDVGHNVAEHTPVDRLWLPEQV